MVTVAVYYLSNLHLAVETKVECFILSYIEKPSAKQYSYFEKAIARIVISSIPIV